MGDPCLYCRRSATGRNLIAPVRKGRRRWTMGCCSSIGGWRRGAQTRRNAWTGTCHAFCRLVMTSCVLLLLLRFGYIVLQCNAQQVRSNLLLTTLHATVRVIRSNETPGFSSAPEVLPAYHWRGLSRRSRFTCVSRLRTDTSTAQNQQPFCSRA